MTPEQIPAELIAILDQRAGKAHSRQGPVAACLAEILTRHEELLHPRAPVGNCVCGQVRGQLHLELGHDLNGKGKRTRCFYFDRSGQCPCLLYEAAGAV
jgi:hypothetical protein